MYDDDDDDNFLILIFVVPSCCMDFALGFVSFALNRRYRTSSIVCDCPQLPWRRVIMLLLLRKVYSS